MIPVKVKMTFAPDESTGSRTVIPNSGSNTSSSACQFLLVLNKDLTLRYSSLHIGSTKRVSIVKRAKRADLIPSGLTVFH